MSNIWDDMRSAVRDAQSTLSAADNVAGDMARMLAEDGRLRRVDSANTLRKLKKQLRAFDSVTGTWKDPRHG